jgi:hypothetical protein
VRGDNSILGYDFWVAKSFDWSISAEAANNSDLMLFLEIAIKVDPDNKAIADIIEAIKSNRITDLPIAGRSVLMETGLTIVEFSCVTNPNKHFEAIVSFEGMKEIGRVAGIGSNFSNDYFCAILRNNYNYRDVVDIFTRGVTTILTLSKSIEGTLSVSVQLARSGDFLGYGLGGSISFSWPSGTITMKDFTNTAIAIREFLPIGALVPPGYRPAPWQPLK